MLVRSFSLPCGASAKYIVEWFEIAFWIVLTSSIVVIENAENDFREYTVELSSQHLVKYFSNVSWWVLECAATKRGNQNYVALASFCRSKDCCDTPLHLHARCSGEDRSHWTAAAMPT